MDCSTPCLPVLHYLPEFAQIHVHWVTASNRMRCKTISSSAAPSPFALNLSQHQGFFEWVSSSHSAKNWRFSISPSSEYSGLISFTIDSFDLLAIEVSSPEPQLKTINSSAFSLLYGPNLTCIHDYCKNHKLHKLLFAKWYLCFLICYLDLS